MSSYPGARGQRRRVAPAARGSRRRPTAVREVTEMQSLISSSRPQVRVPRGFGNTSSPRPSNNANRLEAMQVSQSDGPAKSSADELLLQATAESAPLLRSPSPPGSPYTKGRASSRGGGRRHHYQPAPRRVSNRPTHGSSMGVVRGRNPAPDISIWLCSHGCCCCQCVRSKQVGVVETFGEFQTLMGPGQVCIPWPCTRVAARVSMRIQQLEVSLETKSVDNVFLHLRVVVLFQVNNVYNAHYSLTNAQRQIKSYVLDVVRSTVPRITVDDVFAQTSDIALSLLRRLQGSMSKYGYEILDALVTKITPTQVIVASMNEINASKRIKDSMPFKAEAFKVKKIKDAEAAAERSYLEGVGVANERKAIVRGMRQSLDETQGQFPAKDVMDILLLSHYMDTLVAIGGNSMIVPHCPGELAELENQVSTYFTKEDNEEQPVVNAQAPVIPDLLW